MAESPAERALVDASAGRTGAVLIEAFLHAGLLRDEVAQDVRGARVERDERQVRDPAEIEERDGRALAEEDEIGEGHERCALSAGRNIRAPEVGDGRDAGSQRDARGVAQLEGRALRQVRDGLPMHGEDVRILRQGRNELDRCLRVYVADRHVQGGDSRGAEGIARCRGEDLSPERVVVVTMRGGQHFHVVAVDFDCGDIDPVDGRAGHHSDRDHVLILPCCPVGPASCVFTMWPRTVWCWAPVPASPA